MVLRKLSLVIGLCLLTACGAEKQPTNDTPQEQSTQKNKASELAELKKSIKEKYNKAADTWLEKLAPITDSITKECRQKKDKAYIECIDKKNDELIASSFFPDLVTNMLNARKEFDQKLIKKKITRKEFFEQAGKLQNKLTNDINDRINNDVKSGTYTGKY
jgi:hypothetical protein